MYAIVRVGGKQYRVEEGQELRVGRLHQDEGSTVELEPLLLAGDGDPVFEKDGLGKGAITATVPGHGRGKKIRVVKFKPNGGYKPAAGHRSELTRLTIDSIKTK